MNIDKIEQKAVNELHKSLVKYGADKRAIKAATSILKETIKAITEHVEPH